MISKALCKQSFQPRPHFVAVSSRSRSGRSMRTRYLIKAIPCGLVVLSLVGPALGVPFVCPPSQDTAWHNVDYAPIVVPKQIRRGFDLSSVDRWQCILPGEASGIAI
jgi:hypothetical protein